MYTYILSVRPYKSIYCLLSLTLSIHVRIVQLKDKSSNTSAMRNQFCTIDDLSGYSITRFDNNSFKQRSLTVTGATIKSYQITSIGYFPVRIVIWGHA